jgi:hypothetical protein
MDILFSGDDVAYKSGTYMEPELFKRIYSPHARKMYAPALRAGVPIIFDCDGDPSRIMDMIVELGCSAHFPVDAAGLDYREHKRRWGSRLEPAQVEAYVKEVVLAMKEGGRYVAGTITAIDEIPVENYVTMVNAIHRYGKYAA